MQIPASSLLSFQQPGQGLNRALLPNQRDVYILLPSWQVEGAEARENEKSNLFAGTWANSWLSGVSKFFLFNKTQQSRLSQEALFASFSTSGPTF